MVLARLVRWSIAAWFGLAFAGFSMKAQAAPWVPGTGQKLTQVGDDFEDPSWSFIHNHPKSSEEQDEQKRQPTGRSANGRWYEGIKRGQPDQMTFVPTPEGGLPNSRGSLLIRTLHSGIPGSLSGTMQQDDLVVNCAQRLPSPIGISQNPSAVVRVYVPPFEQWEARSGPSFGFRLALETHAWVIPEEKKKRVFPPPRKEFTTEIYWPGMFIHLRSKTQTRQAQDTAYLSIRGNERGADIKGPEITAGSWWTFGMSVTADGQVHYYASPGVDELTAADHIMSQFPYSYKAEKFRTFFFNVCNKDDGRTWSTPWIIDDPSLYVGSGGPVAQQQPQPKLRYPGRR